VGPGKEVGDERGVFQPSLVKGAASSTNVSTEDSSGSGGGGGGADVGLVGSMPGQVAPQSLGEAMQVCGSWQRGFN